LNDIVSVRRRRHEGRVLRRRGWRQSAADSAWAFGYRSIGLAIQSFSLGLRPYHARAGKTERFLLPAKKSDTLLQCTCKIAGTV
jgi:hypothetical protein